MGPRRKGFFDIFRETRNMQPQKPGPSYDWGPLASKWDKVPISQSMHIQERGKRRSYSSDMLKPLTEVAKEAVSDYMALQKNGAFITPQQAMRAATRAIEEAAAFQGIRKARTTNLDRQAYKQTYNTLFNPQPARGFFPIADQNTLFTSQGLVSLDIETDDYGKPITISATKFYRDEQGQLVAADSFQRYYKSKNSALRKTYDVHGMTRGILNKRRREQGATYSEHYDWREQKALSQFLRNQVIIGHNIHEFDLPHLFGDTPLYQSTVDTVVAARDLWRGQRNDLDSVFQRLFHKTMTQAGLPHHDANSDAIATMMIYDRLARSKTDMGNAIQYVEQHPRGVHTSTRNDYVKSIISYGNYRDYLTKGGSVYMAENETHLKMVDGRWVQSGEPYLSSEDRDNLHLVEEGTSNEALSAIGDVMKYMSDKLTMTQDMTTELNQAFNSFTNYRRGQLVRQLVNMGEEEQIRTLRAHGISGNLSRTMRRQAAALKSIHETEEEEREQERQQEFSKAKHAKLRHELRHNNISVEQFDKLATSSSWDKLIENLDKVTTKNQQYADVIGRIANIPMYNFEQWESAFRGQVSGVTHAASRLAPSFMRGTISSFADAGMNALSERYAGLKYGARAAGTIGNAFIGAGMAAPMDPFTKMALMGTGAFIKGASQVIGNFGEASIVRRGEGIQNNLNTLSMLTGFTLMPFRLMGEAVKAATKLFHKFNFALGTVTSQLGRMAGMGNPMTQMTGLGYGDYMGMVSADYASLLGRGTLSGVINDMATQRAGLYTTGDLDVRRLVAASMLGVFDEVYGTGANEEDQLTAAINKLISSMDGQTEFQKKQTYMLANRINPNMGSILQTMNTLGIRDFNQLKSPAGMVGYTTAQYDRFRPGWQRAQWEFSYAREQYNTTRNRVATAAWNMIGKPIANVFNRTTMGLADMIDNKDWVGIIDTFKQLWSEIKETVKSSGIADMFKYTFADMSIKVLSLLKDTLLPGVFSIWDHLVIGILDRSKGLIDWLSTIKIDWEQLFINAASGNWDKSFITSLKDETYDTRTKDTQGVLDLQAQLRQAYTVKYGTYEGFESKYHNLSKEADMLAAMADLGITGGKDRLDFLVQSHNKAGAAYLHPAWGSADDQASSIVNAGIGVYKNMAKTRNEVTETLLGDLIGRAQSAKENAKVNIEINGQKTGTSLVVNPIGGVSVIRDNIHVNVEAGQNGIPQFVYDQSTGMGGL